jgi:hypothetical protein
VPIPIPQSSPGPSAAAAGPLSPEHLTAIADARIRGRKIRRAASVAALSGWTMAIFAVITLVGGLFGDWVSLLLGAALGVVTFNELRGAAQLRRFEPAGARLLGYNQLGLAALLVLYAGYMLVYTLYHPLLESAGQSTGDAQMDAMLGDFSRTAGLVLYGGVALFGLIGPGLTALYYFTRAKLVRTMVAQTPPWVIEALRAAG